MGALLRYVEAHPVWTLVFLVVVFGAAESLVIAWRRP